jgi:hypothetical protein
MDLKSICFSRRCIFGEEQSTIFLVIARPPYNLRYDL